jgi:hypothetical protein
MKEALKITLIILLVFMAAMCKPGNKAMKQDYRENEPFHLLAKKELGDQFSVEFNEDGRYVLCKSSAQPDPSVSHFTVKFFVMDSKSGEILYSDNLVRGEIEWQDSQTLRISNIPGIIMPDAEVISNTYLYDLVTKKKTTLGSTEKF